MENAPYTLAPWTPAYGDVQAGGVIRSRFEDFQVEELPGFEPSGDGEHVCLLVEKRGENTHWVAEALARLAGVNSRDIGYAGLKDRHALTRQWFSVPLANRAEPDWSQLDSASICILRAVRHSRKIRRGALTGNRFRLYVRELSGDPEALLARLECCRRHGVANYFGEQRFGRGGGNLQRALAMFAGKIRPKRHLRSLYLSTARAFLFNQVLQRRIELQNWNRVLPGDVLMLAGSRSRFRADSDFDVLQQRLDDADVHISGPLFGDGESPVSAEAARLETGIAENYPELVAGLRAARVETDRRPLRLMPADWCWQIDNHTLEMEFTLPAGGYATAVLRELLDYRDACTDPIDL